MEIRRVGAIGGRSHRLGAPRLWPGSFWSPDGNGKPGRHAVLDGQIFRSETAVAADPRYSAPGVRSEPPRNGTLPLQSRLPGSPRLQARRGIFTSRAGDRSSVAKERTEG